MSGYSLNITDIAAEDILSSVQYINDVFKNPVAANNLLDEIERHEKILEETPTIYPAEFRVFSKAVAKTLALQYSL